MESGYSFDQAKFKLGTLCNRGHQWQGTNQSLRRNAAKGACLECEKISIANRPKDVETLNKLKEYRKQYNQTPEAKSKRNQYKERIRQAFKEQGLTSRGTERNNAPAGSEQSVLNKGLKAAGRSLSVARLVMNEQLRYWRENPSAKADHDRQWGQASWWLEYQTKPKLRLYNRDKSKRRKARIKGNTFIEVSPEKIKERFELFNNCCAYCGQSGDMQIEHAIPISKGGTHAIGNILPACRTCNYSKRDKEIESWYRSQSVFTELRWRKICRTLGWTGGAVNQLAMI
jgi:5-methylcytosine-specific restriction endonuclease McrA